MINPFHQEESAWADRLFYKDKIDSQKKHKETCAKNRSKRKNKNKKK